MHGKAVFGGRLPPPAEGTAVTSRNRARRIVASAHAAFQRPLQGRPYHDLGRKGVVPFLAPSDGVPFACFLTLHRASASSCEERPAVQAAAQHEVMELVYVLDGSGQLRQEPGQDALPLHAGDSLAISSGTAMLEAFRTAGCRPDDWHLATLHLLFNAGGQVADGSEDTVQTALDSRLAVPSNSRVTSAASAAISQRIAVAPQPSAGQTAEDVTIDASGGGGSSSSSNSDSSSRLTRHQHTQQQLVLPLLRAQKAIQRLLQQVVRWQRWRLRGVVQRKLSELDPVRLPNQTNRLALAFSPLQSPPSSFCCGLEVFQPSHVTAPHVHTGAWELFFILSGSGSGFCEEERLHIKAGDVVAFPPGCVHGIDNADDAPMYTIEVMLPAGGPDALDFAAFAQAGVTTSFSDDELSALFAPGCSSVAS